MKLTKKAKDNWFVFTLLVFPIIQWLVFWLYLNFSSILMAFQDPITEEFTFYNFELFFKAWREGWANDKGLKTAFVNTLLEMGIGNFLDDGRKGLDRLIEYSDYIAVSVPELRIHMPKEYKENTHKLAYYIKNRKPEIDVHLLGCTEPAMLRRNNFCTSSDSTSWQAVNRFGNIMGKNVRAIKHEVKAEAYRYVLEVLDKCGIEVTDKRIDYYSNYYVSAKMHKMLYERYAGDQD